MQDQMPYQNPRELALNTGAQSMSAFMQAIYLWMTGGLIITGFIAWMVANSPNLTQTFLLNRNLFYLLLFAEIGIVLAMSFGANKFSAMVLATCFIVYSVLNGLTLSIIFLVYTASSITQVFFISAGMFGGMSLYGYATKKDLTSLGSFMMMGLWGIILASIVNIFWQNDGFHLLISIIGVFVFLGLTAYDTQKLKDMAAHVGDDNSESFQKTVVLGALTLYLDFINLFLNLLSLFGKRR